MYDTNYNPVTEVVVLENSAYEPEGNIESDHRKFPIPNFPEAIHYETFFDFEQAIREWKSHTESILNWIHLPFIAGRQYYRPKAIVPTKHHKLSNTSEESFTDEEAISDNSLKRKPSSDLDLTAYSRDSPRSENSDNASQENSPRSVNDKEDVVSDGNSQNTENSEIHKINSGSSLDFADQDPWDTVLFPHEPTPENYNIYGDYETAVKNWAYLCSQISKIPPHPVQLQDIIDTIVAGEIISSSLGGPALSSSTMDAQQDSGYSKITVRSGIVLLHILQDPLNENITLFRESPAVNIYVCPDITNSIVDNVVSKKLIEVISGIFTDPLLVRRMLNWESIKSFSKPTLPKLHGTLPSKYTQKNTKHVTQLFKLKGLRRIDINENSTKQYIEIGENKVLLDVDIIEPEIPLNLDKMRDSKYKSEMQEKIFQWQYLKRLEHLYSSY